MYAQYPSYIKFLEKKKTFDTLRTNQAITHDAEIFVSRASGIKLKSSKRIPDLSSSIHFPAIPGASPEHIQD